MNHETRRSRQLKLALLSLLAAAALLVSPMLAARVYANPDPVCQVNCRNGSCTGTGNCTCTCSFWTSTAVCTCQDPPPPTEG
jgi:hypothetical protein